MSKIRHRNFCWY